MKGRKKLIISIMMALLMALGLTACGAGGYNQDALHINYTAEDNYGSDDYLGSTLIIGGSGMETEVQFTVQELEELALENESLQYQGSYSMMSRGGVFSNHEFTGIKLYELLQEYGLKEDLPDDTLVRFVSVDGYALTMELGEIRESTDCTFAAKTDTQPTDENVPKILAFGSDGVPLTGTVGAMKLGEKITAEQGYVDEAENEGGPIRLISGQQSVGEFNAPDNAKWLRQIIIGEDNNAKAHSDALAAEQALRANDTVTVDLKSGSWDHSQAPYDQYLNTELKITGSEATAKTYTLEELEKMEDVSVADSFGASCGVFGFKGIPLKELVMNNLADGVEMPSKITVIGEDGYETEVVVEDMINGVDSRYQNGEHRDVIIAYAMNGSPLVINDKSEGFTGENGYGPLRLVVENQTTRWVKNVVEIRIGE